MCVCVCVYLYRRALSTILSLTHSLTHSPILPFPLHYTSQEDPWNSIISGATTGGILAARAGPRAMASAAVVGGVLLALIEGMGIMFTKAMAPPVPTREDYERAAHRDTTAPPVQASNPFAGMGAPPPPSNSAPPPPSSSDDLTDMNSGTTFSTEGGSSSSSGDTGSSGSGGSWFSFG